MLRSICMLAAWVSSAFGGLMLGSWFMSSRSVSLAQGIPLFVSCGFFLIGLAFFCFAYHRARLTHFLGVVTMVAGVFTFMLGVLNFLPIATGTPFYSLIQGDSSSALGFIRLTSGVSAYLMGIWFTKFPVSKDTATRVTLGLIIGSLLFGIGVFSITQQYLWIPLLGGVSYLSASVVALGQMCLGGLLLSISYRDHVHLFSRALWAWLLMPLGIVLLMGTLVMSHFLQKQQEDRVAGDMRSAGNQLEAILNTFLNERILFMQRFAHRLEDDFARMSSGGIQEDGVRMFMATHPDLVRIRWIYLDGKNIWTLVPMPLSPEIKEGEDVALVYLAQQDLSNAMNNSQSVSIMQTNRGFSLVSPVRRDGKIVSVLIFDFNASTFLNELPKPVLPEGYSIQIRDKKGNLLFPTFEPYTSSDAIPLGSKSYRMSLQGLLFNLEMAPLPTNFSYQIFFLPWLVLLAGSTISLLLIWAYWLAQTTQLAQKEAMQTNVALKDENVRRSLVEHELRKTQDELEVKIVERTEQLTRSNQELEQFTFIASHDLQEPVRKVANYLDLLVIHSKDKLPAEAQRDVDRILKSVLHMKQLLSELMGLLRVRHDNAPFEEVNLSDEMHTVLSGLDNIEGIHVKVDPLPMVLGNKLRLRQLFHNLVSNAVKFRGKEAPAILVSAHQENDEWVISIRDNGIGIEPEHKGRIFEIFQRLNPRGYPGSGMGLAICKRIIESHGGKIWVESAPGYGSTFKFTLPVHKEVSVPNHDEIIVG
jgi:signal transduction histidine kinase